MRSTKFTKLSHPLIIYTSLLMFVSMASAKKLGVLRLGSSSGSFGAINFDRIRDYVLVNATYLTIENIKLMQCISKCKKNKACLSLNFRKMSSSGGGTRCELNDHIRYTMSELAFQKQSDSEHYEVQSPCKKAVCRNGGKCHFDQMKGTHQCRCPLQFSGEQCEKKNVHADKILTTGIVNGELFLVGPRFNYAEAATVCQAFGADLATVPDVDRAAIKAATGICKASWTKSGRIGYPEYEGGCHSDSTQTGYYQYNCCLHKGTTYMSAWCIKKKIDFCKPGWYAFGRLCILFRDDDSVNREEAVQQCERKGAQLFAQFRTTASILFANRICASCSPMFTGAIKVGDVWQHPSTGVTVEPVWAVNEPNGGHTCSGLNPKANGMSAIPCNTQQGFICVAGMFD